MRKHILMLCLTLLAFGAKAEGIVFSSTLVEATAVAVTGDGLPGFEQQQGITGATVFASADSVGSDVATAGAISGAGLLTTSADAAAVAFANAVATARFAGAFGGGGGTVNLLVDFLNLDLASGTGAAGTTLFISLIEDGVTLFEDFVTGPWSFSYVSAAGSNNWLDVLLTSEASASVLSPGAGNGAAFGQVSIAGTVPETTSLLLLALGLAALVYFRPRRPPGVAAPVLG